MWNMSRLGLLSAIALIAAASAASADQMTLTENEMDAVTAGGAPVDRPPAFVNDLPGVAPPEFVNDLPDVAPPEFVDRPASDDEV